MSKTVSFMTLLAAALTAVAGGHVSYAWAQADGSTNPFSGTPPMFSYVNSIESSLAPQEIHQLKIYEEDPTADTVSLVSFHLDVLKTADALTMEIKEDSFLLDRLRIEERDLDDYSFFGSSSNIDGADAVIVVKGTDVFGTIHAGNETYRVRPLNGEQVLIRVDQDAYPEEHPPQFKEIERQSHPAESPELAPSSDADACNEYRVIIAYTPAAKAQVVNMDALVQLAIDGTNQSYMKSKINTRITPAYTYQTNYIESGNMFTDRDRFRKLGDEFMDEVHTLRDTHSADVAILITRSDRYCGIASAIKARAETAFAVVGQNCATDRYSFAHEIGHLQGARHNPEDDPVSVPFEYGHGFFFREGRWRTIMSSNCTGGCKRLDHWSNPMISLNGVPTGTVARHDNVRVLNETSCTIANFRTEDQIFTLGQSPSTRQR